MVDEIVDKNIEKLKSGTEVRQSLAALRQELKKDVSGMKATNRSENKPEEKSVDKSVDNPMNLPADQMSIKLIDAGLELNQFLKNEDAKTRKNVALLIGDLKMEQYLSDLYQAYLDETTLFVRSSYLSAMAEFELGDYEERLKALYEEIKGQELTEENKKHINEERKQLEKILIKLEGITTHTFCDLKSSRRVILTTNPEHREVTLDQVGTSDKKVISGGVLVKTDRVTPLYKIRTFREMLFPLSVKSVPGTDAEKAGELLAASDLYQLLTECHEEDTPFYFRMEIRGRLPLDKKSAYAKKAALSIENHLEHKMINSTSDYEIEIRLMETKDGNFHPYVKLNTIHDERFSYRKNSIATSIHPAGAALLMKLAEPFMRENVQILDPFCGVGTMLVEREKIVHAREIYGIDIFGEAIAKARENTELAEMQVNYINRDFFEFKHEYLFNEIITNMPMRGKKTREEQDAFYQRFFEKAQEHLDADGIIIMYSNENGFVKKQLRINEHLRLQQEFLIREKDGFYLFIIKVRGH